MRHSIVNDAKTNKCLSFASIEISSAQNDKWEIEWHFVMVFFFLIFHKMSHTHDK